METAHRSFRYETLSSVISDYYRKLRVLLSQFCTILGDVLVRNRAFMGTNRIGFPIFI